MIYKRVFTPDKENHIILIPNRFFGKKVEISISELNHSTTNSHPAPPVGKKISLDELFEDFGANPDFPSIDGIKAKA